MSEPVPPDGKTRVSPPRATPETLKPDATGNWSDAGQSASRSAPPARLGRFEIRKVLGEGAFGRVYLAFDPELERQVAIKVPHRDGLTPAFRERFLREARATAAIHHPNVCPVYEVGTDGDVPYIVMHYVVGGTLDSLLGRANGSLPPRHALAIARKLALGMAAAHAQGVIHRDLKPANVLFDKATREVLITDFGLARIASSGQKTADGAVMGTPAYMSPEQARGKMDEVGPLSDVYALGVVLYRMLAGDVPFHGSVFEVMVQHWETPPQPPSARCPGLDPKLDAICLKAMAKKPADRYPSAKALAGALADYLRGEEQVGSVELVPANPPVPEPAPPKAAAPAKPGGNVRAPEPRHPENSGAAPLPQSIWTYPSAVEEPAPVPIRSAKRPAPPPSFARHYRTWALLAGLVIVVGSVGLGIALNNRKPTAPGQPSASSTPNTVPKAPTSREPEPRKAKEPEPKPKEPEPKPKEARAATAASERAFALGLAWLAQQQSADGGWKFDRGRTDERVAATGLALRPYLAAGISHKKPKNADERNYDRVVAKGLGYLTNQCPLTGANAGCINPAMYVQGIATFALCEAYRLTNDPALKPYAQAAIDYVQGAQMPNGSWGYGKDNPDNRGDLSVTGWQVQALKAAQLSGLVVDAKVMTNANKFLDAVAVGPSKSMYGYTSNMSAAPFSACTASGLLCRSAISNWDATHPGMIDGVGGLMKNPPRGSGAVTNLYYYHYATQVVRAYGGNEWRTWNEGVPQSDGTSKGGMRDWLVNSQVGGDGAALGSWNPETGYFGTECGRLGTTAICLVILDLCNR